MGINDWPEAERPRERLLSSGAPALSDAELLAILLRVGVRGKSAVELARDLLRQFDGNLAALMSAPIQTLTTIPGMGPAKAVQLAAIMELARRSIRGELVQRSVFSSPKAVKDWLQLRIGCLSHEVFLALWLDSGHCLLATDELFRGTLTHTHVHPREVVKAALGHNAAAVIIAHNHPSGRVAASPADIELTRQLKNALALVDVRLLDHLIVPAGGPPESMAEAGLL